MVTQDTPVITAQQWISLPAEFRRPGSSEHSKNQKRNRKIDSFLEGPVFISHLSCLFVTDIPYGRIFSIDIATATWSLFLEYDGEPNGMAWNPLTEKIVIADFKQGILSLDLTTKTVTPLATRYHGERFKGPNDLVVAPDGSIYFTDQGMTGLHDPSGRVYRLFPNGRLDPIITNGPSPNGLVLTRDKTSLLVAMTRDNAVWHIPFYEDGSVQRVGRYSSYYGIGGPDGMALDEEGNVFVAHSTLGTIYVHGSNGKLKTKIESSVGNGTTNLTWGGEKSNVLYIVESESASILRVDWHCAGCL
ncbi:calcium-dependent phosphotriesterase [Penicillium angulare]|uniref:calcium-dependent phosphotriesterase n=1 Tax=Penicillium angulare TaxID=116970 RepID=UPI002541388D|nr:calcium-dependent phosphotriesterase [Penicillium angulare]KAJ5279142.1 calcium-dependent phosphotriesterase [Penicillium angulare]